MAGSKSIWSFFDLIINLVNNLEIEKENIIAQFNISKHENIGLEEMNRNLTDSFKKSKNLIKNLKIEKENITAQFNKSKHENIG